MESLHTNASRPHRLGRRGRGAEDVTTDPSVGRGHGLLRTAIQTILLLAAVVGFAKGMGSLSRSIPRVPAIPAPRSAR